MTTKRIFTTDSLSVRIELERLYEKMDYDQYYSSARNKMTVLHLIDFSKYESSRRVKDRQNHRIGEEIYDLLRNDDVY